jgi:hypothetical protein
MARYDCTNCHAHELARMQRRHSPRLLGNVKLEQCATCHRLNRRRAAAEGNIEEVLLALLGEPGEPAPGCPLRKCPEKE